MMNKPLALSAALFLLVGACTHEVPLSQSETPSAANYEDRPCSPDSVYFQNTILPLLVSNCAMSGCHDAGSHRDGLVLTSYQGILRIVQPGNPGSSKLVSVVTTSNSGDIMPPPPRSPLALVQIDWIKKWISQGARDNSCSSCDTAAFTFNATIFPLIKNKCNGCHATAASGGGILLATYDQIKAMAQSGQLMGSIERLSGYSPMPKWSNKLPDCEITQVKKWIAAGILNN